SPTSTKPRAACPCRSRLWRWPRTRKRSKSSARPIQALRSATSWAQRYARRRRRSRNRGAARCGPPSPFWLKLTPSGQEFDDFFVRRLVEVSEVQTDCVKRVGAGETDDF